jgi:tetratricopeptide (TPR) repeat protein
MAQSPEFCMPLLVRHCTRERMSGTLTISRTDDPSAVKTFVFDGGMIVFATSSSPEERLGERLVAWGVIDRDGLHRALERARTTGEVLGRALVASGVTSAENVRTSGDRIILERASEPFRWSSAAAFFEDKLGPTGGVPAGIAGEVVQFAGMRTVQDIGRVRAWAGDPGELVVPALDPFRVLQSVTLLPEEGYLIARLDRPMTIDEITTLSGMDDLAALRLVCALRFCDLLVPAETSRGATSWIGERVAFSELVAKRFTITSDTSADTVYASEAARVCYLVEEKLRSLEGTDYYALLEVERRSPVERIKSSYRELAKTFHPDRHAQLAAFDVNIKKHLGAIFDALTKAYVTLTSTAEREAYDRKLADRDQRGARPAPDVGRPTHPPAPKPRPQDTGPLAPPVSRAVPRATGPPAAGPPVVPASKGRSIPQAAAQQPRAPRAIPETRVQTPHPVSKAPKPPPASPAGLTADEWYQRGTAFAEAGNHAQAMRALRRGAEIAPEDARIHAALGRTLSAMGGIYRSEAEKVLKRAVELAPDYIEGYLELGKLYKAAGRRELAREQFLRVLMVNPDDEEARAEIGGTEKQPTGRKRRFSFRSLTKK